MNEAFGFTFDSILIRLCQRNYHTSQWECTAISFIILSIEGIYLDHEINVVSLRVYFILSALSIIDLYLCFHDFFQICRYVTIKKMYDSEHFNFICDKSNLLFKMLVKINFQSVLLNPWGHLYIFKMCRNLLLCDLMSFQKQNYGNDSNML